MFLGYYGGPLMNPLARVQKTVSCPECRGTGTCAACDGSGIVVGVIGDDERAYSCGTCDGDGFCSFCSGSGEVEEEAE